MNLLKFFAFAFLLIAVACNKKDKLQENPPPPPLSDTYSFKADVNNATPGRLIILTSNKKLQKDTFNLTLAGKTAIGARVNDTTLAFYLPVVPAGIQVISISNLSVVSPVSLTVDPYTIITNPATVINEFVAKTSSVIDSITKLTQRNIAPLPLEYANKLKLALDNFHTRLSALSADQKIEVAYIINQYSIDPSIFSTTSLDPSVYGRILQDDNSAEIQRHANEYVLENIRKRLAIKDVAVAVAIGALVGIATSPVLGVAVGAAILSYSIWNAKVFETGKEEASIKGVFSGIGKALGPRTSSVAIQLSHNVPKTYKFYGNFRTILQSDASGNSPLLKSLLASYDTVSKEEQAMIKTLQSYGSVGQEFLDEIVPSVNPFNTTSTGKESLMDNSKIQLKNVSDSRITLTYSPDMDGIRITAKGDSIKEQTDFTFDLVYNQPALEYIKTETVNAKFTPDTMSVIIAKGTWTASQGSFDGENLGSPYQLDHFEKCNSGPAVRIIDSFTISFRADKTCSFKGKVRYACGTNVTPSQAAEGGWEMRWTYLPNGYIRLISVDAAENGFDLDIGEHTDMKIISFSSTTMELSGQPSGMGTTLFKLR